MVWQVVVPGAQTVTETFGIFTNFAAPALTVMGTAFEPFAGIGGLFALLADPPPEPPPEPPEPPPDPLPELLLELSPPPPPHAPSAIATNNVVSQRTKRMERREDGSMLKGVGRMCGSPSVIGCRCR
jgi:hypothetical protein